jgi:DNA polymerase-3 subunit delta'
MQSDWRVVLIDAADEMSEEGANALLKTLEEPSRRALLLLVSHAPGQLPATIRSRCRSLALGTLSDQTVAEILAAHRPALAEEDRLQLARLAEGSPGRAIALADAGSLDLYRELAGLLLPLPRLDVPALHALADRVGRFGAEATFRTAADLLSWWLARLVRAGATRRLPREIVPGERACMQRLLAGRGLDQWLALWDNVTRLFASADEVNLDRKQVWVGAFLKIEALARR